MRFEVRSTENKQVLTHLNFINIDSLPKTDKEFSYFAPHLQLHFNVICRGVIFKEKFDDGTDGIIFAEPVGNGYKKMKTLRVIDNFTGENYGDQEFHSDYEFKAGSTIVLEINGKAETFRCHGILNCEDIREDVLYVSPLEKETLAKAANAFLDRVAQRERLMIVDFEYMGNDNYRCTQCQNTTVVYPSCMLSREQLSRLMADNMDIQFLLLPKEKL